MMYFDFDTMQYYSNTKGSEEMVLYINLASSLCWFVISEKQSLRQAYECTRCIERNPL